MNDENLTAEFRAIHEKLDRLIALVEEDRAKVQAARSKSRPSKPKPLPLSETEITELQGRFSSLFSRWLEGHEVEVQDELGKLDADDLRRFADANNLNVTAKMSKDRVLQLIGARFREKRQLIRGAASGGEGVPPSP